MMTIYPAIDIYNGKVVRLECGDYEKMTVYNDDPVSVAQEFISAADTTGHSAQFALHLVDLEGAREGRPMNFNVISKIAAQADVFIQTGGGIRTEDSIKKYLDAGVSRVVLGTKAIEQPGFLRDMVAKFGNAIAVSADVKDGYAAIRGWTELSQRDIFSFCETAVQIGVKTIICTDISKDGMQSGTNIGLYRSLSSKLTENEATLDIIASGGVSSVDEIKMLDDMGISGVILGKALYEGIINFKDALAYSKLIT